MPLITLGDSTKLQVKVPSKGDTNWESDFKTEFAQKIVDHDHTGVDGKGAKIAEAAIEDGAITTAKIADGAVTSVKIAADAVADIDLAPNSVGTSELKDANVTNAKLGFECVSTDKIETYAVTAAKINSNVVLSTLGNVSSTSPTSGQVLKWSGSEWAPAVDLAGSAGTLVTISSQTDANSYSNSAGDTVVIDATEDVSFSSAINDTTIFIAGNDNVEFESLSSCTVRGGSGTITCKSMSTTNLNTPGTFIFKNSSSTVSMDNSFLICTNFNFLISDTGLLSINRSHIKALNVGYSGGSGSNKVHMNAGAVIECSAYGVLNSAMDIRMHKSSELRVQNTFHGKVIDQAGTGTILDRSTSNVIVNPFTIIDNIVRSDIPIAARFTLGTSQNGFDTATFANFTNTVDSTGDLTLSSGKAVIATAGFYNISAGLYVNLLDNGSDNARLTSSIKVGTTTIARDLSVQTIFGEVMTTISTMHYLEVGDEVGLELLENGDSTNSCTLRAEYTFLALNKIS